MNKRMILMLLVVGLVFGGIFGFKAFVNTQITAAFDNMPPETATITAGEARREAWVPRLEAIGTLVPVDGAVLANEVAGVVTAIHFGNGSRVRAGERLLSLDSRTDEADLRSLEAAARLASLELERTRRLFEQKNVSEADLQRRQSEAEQADAAVAAQRVRIAQKSIRAPFTGVAGIRRVNVGEYLPPGTPIVALESLDPIFINFTLPERRLGQVRRGQPVEVRVDATDALFRGEITAIEPRVRIETRTFEVQATLANPEERLRPGLFGRVTLETGAPEQVVVVPQTAVRYNPYGNSVFLVNEDADGTLRVTQRFVQTGARRGDLISVTQGLKAGERVATSGLLKLQNDSPVRISEVARPSEDLDPRPANR